MRLPGSSSHSWSSSDSVMKAVIKLLDVSGVLQCLSNSGLFWCRTRSEDLPKALSHCMHSNRRFFKSSVAHVMRCSRH